MKKRKSYRQARQILKYRRGVLEQTGRLLPIGQARKEWLIIQKLCAIFGPLETKSRNKVLRISKIMLDLE